MSSAPAPNKRPAPAAPAPVPAATRKSARVEQKRTAKAADEAAQPAPLCRRIPACKRFTKKMTGPPALARALHHHMSVSADGSVVHLQDSQKEVRRLNWWRVFKMTDNKLKARARTITLPHKLYDFVRVLRAYGLDEIADIGENRFYDMRSE